MMPRQKNSDYYLGNIKLPTARSEFEYTPEMLKHIKRSAKNVLYFAEYFFYIIDPDEGRQRIKLFSFQKRCLRMLRDNRKNILLASRQVGKTTLLTIYALWEACFNEDKNIVIVANKEATAKEIFRRVRLAYEELPNWLKPGVEEWGMTGCQFANGSRIWISTTTGSSARGTTINCYSGDSNVTVRTNDNKMLVMPIKALHERQQLEDININIINEHLTRIVID